MEWRFSHGDKSWYTWSELNGEEEMGKAVTSEMGGAVMDKRILTGVLLALILVFTVTGYAQEVDSAVLLERCQEPVFLLLSDQLHLLEVTGVGNIEQQYGKPPLSKERIVNEILAGGAGGVALGLVGMFVGAGLGGLFCDEDETDEDVSTLFFPVFDEEFLCGLKFVLVGAIAGYALGTPVGVYLAGSTGDQTGSFLSALIGSVAALGGVLVASQGDMDQNIEEFMFWAAPPIFATIGFNLTRRYKSPIAESETALINLRDGRMSLAVPRVYLRPDSFGRGSLSQSVDLLKVRF